MILEIFQYVLFLFIYFSLSLHEGHQKFLKECNFFSSYIHHLIRQTIETNIQKKSKIFYRKKKYPWLEKIKKHVKQNLCSVTYFVFKNIVIEQDVYLLIPITYLPNSEYHMSSKN